MAGRNGHHNYFSDFPEDIESVGPSDSISAGGRRSRDLGSYRPAVQLQRYLAAGY